MDDQRMWALVLGIPSSSDQAAEAGGGVWYSGAEAELELLPATKNTLTTTQQQTRAVRNAPVRAHPIEVRLRQVRVKGDVCT